ncbi:hypothetical protein JCM6882_003306 [Rhodosporidiobolus microsporus]
MLPAATPSAPPGAVPCPQSSSLAVTDPVAPTTTAPEEEDGEIASVEQSTASDEGKAEAEGQEADGSVGDAVWVDWDGPSDPANPLQWSSTRKWLVTGCGIAFCFVVSIAVSAYSIASESIQESFGCSQELALLTVTLFTIAFAIVPLVLAPLSEHYGRSRIYLTTATVHTLFYIPEALVPSLPALLVLRFFSGCAGSAGLSIVGGTIVDCFAERDRGVPMAAFSLVAFGAPSCGSIIFGYVAERLGYTYINWILLALSASITLVLFFVLKETRSTVILARKASRLQASDASRRYISVLEQQTVGLSVGRKLRTALLRPLTMLATEPVLMAFTAWISFTWGVLYLSLVSIPIIYKSIYSFSVGETGLVYISQVVGILVGVGFDRACNILYMRHVATKGPEARLYTGLGAAIFVPIGSFFWAFTTYPHVHWVVPCIGMAILYTGMFCCFLCVHAYLADAYNLYAASALSSMLLCRNLVGASFPLFTGILYDRLGIQGASGLTAGIGTVLSAVPILLFFFGAKLRQRSPFSAELRQREEALSSSSTAVEKEKPTAKSEAAMEAKAVEV